MKNENLGSIYNVLIHPLYQNLMILININKPKEILKTARGAASTYLVFK